MGKRSMLRFKFFGTHPSICNTMRGAMIRGVLTTSMGSTSDDPSGPSLFSYLCDKSFQSDCDSGPGQECRSRT
jgi:hypothetical protein